MSPFDTFQYEIERVCSYVKDDGTVAGYFGITRDEVRRVRKRMPKPRQRNVSHFLDKNTPPLALKTLGVPDARANAEMGSERLKSAIDKVFRRFEIKHGLQPGAGQILLPAGWNGFEQ